MGRRFAEIAFTPAVKEEQERHGSRRQYQRVEEQGEPGNRLGPHERAFIHARDGFYMSTISETGLISSIEEARKAFSKYSMTEL